MAKEVKLPDGTTLSFPDDATIDEITAAVNSPEVEKLSVKPYEDAEASRPARMTQTIGGRSLLAGDITPPAAEEKPKGGLLSPREERLANEQAKRVGDVAAGRVGGTDAEIRDEALRAKARETAMSDPVRNIEATVEALPQQAKKVAGGLIQATAEGAGGRPLEGLMPEQLSGPAGPAPSTPADVYADIGATWGAAADAEEKKIKAGLKPGLGTEAVQTAIESAAIMLPAMATGGTAALGAGGVTAAARAAGARMLFGTMGATTFGTSYGEARRAGMDPADAGAYGALQAMIEVGTEFAPLRALFSAQPNFAKRFANFMVQEVPQELLATTLQAAVDKASINPNMTWEDFQKQLALTVLSTPLAGGAQTVVAHGASGLVGAPKYTPESRARVIAEELERAVDTTEFAQSAESVAASLLNPAGAQMRVAIAPVLEATSSDEAIAAATAAATGQPQPAPQATPTEDSTPAAASATLGGTATSTTDEQLFTDGASDDTEDVGRNDTTRSAGGEGADGTVAAQLATARQADDQRALGDILRGTKDVVVEPDGWVTLEGHPLVAVAPAALPESPSADRPNRLTREQAEAIDALAEKSGKRVIFYEDHGLLPDGFVAQHVTNGVVFVSDNPQKAGSFVASHELTHAFDDLKDLADAVRAVVNREITADGIDMMQKRHGLKFPSDPVAQRAFLVKEAAADLGGWALSDPQFLPKVVEEVRARQGDEAATGVVKKLLGAITKAIKAVQRIFRQEPDLSAKVVTNLEAVRDALAKLYGAQYSSQIEIEKAKLEGLRRKNGPAYEVYDSATGRAVPGRRYPERSRAETAAGTENLNEGTRARYKVREADVTKSPKVANAKREEYAGSHGQDQRTAGPQLQADEDLHRSVAGGRPAEGWSRATRIRRGDGQPLAVYRGAAAALAPEHFELGALGRASGNASSGLGVWFTVSAAEADTYGEREAFFLDIRKPFVVRVEELPGFDSVQAAHQWREGLRAAGHDGLLVTAKHLGGRVHVVAFDAQQVVRPAGEITKSRKESDESLEAHVLRADRQARTEGVSARLNETEKAAVEAAAKASGISARVIGATIRGHKRAHPQSQGWAPLVFTRLKETAKGSGKWDYQYETISYGFDKDKRGRRFKPGSKAYARRVEAFGQRIADEVRAIHDRAQNGNTAARNIIRQAGWYRNMRDRLRREFGGLGDLFADLLGATSPNTPVRDNWSNASDVLRRATKGDFDELMPEWVAWVEDLEIIETAFRGVVNGMLDAGMTRKEIKATAEYQWWKARTAEARKFPAELLPTKESGKNYGFNGRNVVRALVDLWRVVKNANPDIARGGTAPKALNFSGNLIGFREGATIDVWAARLLQRLAGLLRIPSRAETAVSGEMRASGETTLQFGFGQDVFERAAELIRQDPSMSRDETLKGLNPDDLQALVWFIEKEIWTRNSWTSAAGEGGSFEFEADLAGVKDTDKVRALRRVADSSRSTPAERTNALRELDAMKRPLSRIIAGLSIQASVGTQGFDYLPTDADMAQTAERVHLAMHEGGARWVVGAKVLSSQGRYGTDVERAFDVEGVFMDGYDAGPLWKSILEVARDSKQDSTFISRALFESEDVDPAKHVPGVEIYFREARALEAAEETLKQLAGLGVGNYTIIVDARRSPAAIAGAMPAVVGVRFQWIPEFDVRYGGPEAAPATDVELAARAKEKAAEYTRLAEAVKAQLPGVSYAKALWYDTEVRFAHEYQGAIDALANRDVGDDDSRGGAGPWSGRQRREGLQAAARQHEIASRAAGERESAASESRDADDRDAGQVTRSPKSGEENREALEAGREGPGDRASEPDVQARDGRDVADAAARDRALARVPEGFSRQVGPRTPVVSFGRGPNAVAIVGIHYGNIEGLAALDGTKFGTGARSEEARRLSAESDLRKRVYFYAQEQDARIPHSEPTVNAPYIYRAVLGNIYDFGTDPDGIIPEWRKLRTQFPNVDRDNILEGLVLAAGYDGYLNRQAGALVVMGRDSVPAEFLGDRGEAWQAITKSAKFDVTETAAFKRWFGDSKVVDAEGKPLVVYHWTDAHEDFVSFEQTNDIGFHFGSRRTANTRGRQAARFGGPEAIEGQRIMPVYLAIENPLRLPDLHTWSSGAVVWALYDAGVLTAEEASQRENDTVEREDVAAWLAAKGYDGIVYKNETEKGGDSYIAFHPEQIKSAIGNNGEFDPGNADITKSSKAFAFRVGDEVVDPRTGATGVVDVVRPRPYTFDDIEYIDSRGERQFARDTELRHAGVIQASPKQRETEEFKRWAGGAEFISREDSLAHEFASGEPVVVETLHGTTGSFTRFSRDRADPEADLGAGFYSTNNPRDVAANYAGEGPDLTNKIMRLVERNYNDEDLETVGEDFARNQARLELGVEHGGLTMPLYVRFRNPAVLGGRRETLLSYDDRTLERFANAVRKAAEGYDVYRLEDALAKLDEGPLRDAKVVVSTMDVSDDQGNLVGSEIFRRALERMGFDGVIDQTVSDKFRTMDGMDERGTTHFVAFKPNQMKSAIGNRGTFNRGDDITKSPKEPQFTEAFWRWFGDSKVVDAEGRPLVMYHGTGESFNVFKSYKNNAVAGFFSPSPKFAGAFAEDSASGLAYEDGEEASGASVIPVYISAQKVWDYENEADVRALADALRGTDTVYERRALATGDHTIVENSEVIEAIKALGYDAFYVNEGDSSGNAATKNIGVFRPEQIKSAIGNDGTYEPNSADITKSPKQWYYSALTRAVESAGMKAAPASAWRDWLRGQVQKGVVKTDELEWSGVNDWLGMQQGKVTRDAVASFLAANGVRVEEVVKGNAAGFTQAQQERLDELESLRERTDEEDAERQALIRAENRASDERGDTNQTKFGQWQLPGGKNYRELLLTLPEARGPFGAKFQARELPDGAEVYDRDTGQAVERATNLRTAIDRANAYNRANNDTPVADRNFRSSHFDQPNILAHIRFNERTDADGKRVLFVEEIQSDWAQKGRDQGFADPAKRADIERRVRALGIAKPLDQVSLNDLIAKRADPQLEADFDEEVLKKFSGASRAPFVSGRKRAEVQAITEERLDDRGRKRTVTTGWKVFVTTDGERKEIATGLGEKEARALAERESKKIGPTTEAWVALALKRVIAYAAEHGFDRVAWTTGDQQADRYDLSKHIADVTYDRNSDGTYVVAAHGRDDRTVWRDLHATEKVVEEHLGKDIAKRIFEGGEAEGVLRGLDLKVGGEGMQAFYDKIVPNVANDVLKKLGGGRIDASKIGEQSSYSDEIVYENEVPGFDITPALRAKAGAGEVPLFSRKIDFRRGDAVVNKRTGETGTVDVVRPRPYTYDDVEFIDSKGERQTARDTELRHAGTIQRSAKYDVTETEAVDNKRPTDSPDITKSPKSAITNRQIPAAWQATELTEFDAVVRALQDKLVDTKRVVATIRESGIDVPENLDPYLQEMLFHGRAAKRVNDFAQNELRPLLTDMQARGVKMQDLEDYLWAAHAAERNAQIAAVNPSMPDAGSGLTNAQAADILAGLPVTIHGRTIQLDGTKMAAYAALQARVNAITDRTLDTLVAYGLESKAMVDTWRRTYKSYVPLRRDMEADKNFLGAFNLGLGTGQGFSVRGPSSRRAMGSERNVIDVLANLAMQRERAIVRGEKNRIAQAVYGLATKAPNKDFWLPLNPDLRKVTRANELYAQWKADEAAYNARLAAGANPNDPAMTSLELKWLKARDDYNALIPVAQALQTKVEQELVAMGLNPADARAIAKEPQERYIEPNTGMVMWRINPRLTSQPEVLSLRMNGENRFVIFSNDERAKAMVTGLKNLDAESLGYILATSAAVTRWFASVNTQYNPVFGLVNGMRDTGASVLNLGATPLRGQQAKVLKYAASALSGIYADLRAHRAGRQPTSVWAQRFEEMGMAGGQTGYRDAFQTSAARADALTRELKALADGKRKWFKINEANPIFAWLSDYNTSIENAIRVAVFQAARDMGMSDAKAASLAKGITVNFNKQGTAATNTGALYAFFNAGVQGTARIAETMLEHKGDPSKAGNLRLTSLGKKIVVGGLVLGVIQALLGAAAGWDDDEPKQFQRERNFLVPVPGTDRYVAIPYPLGYHVLPNMGRIATEFVLSGGKNVGKRLTQLVSVIAGAFNPIGGGDLIDAITPTAVDPLIALARNKDWTGNQIAREDANKFHPTPGWARTKDTATPWARGLSYVINYATGGGAFGKGLASPTPDQIDYLIGQATGGVGREIGKIAQTLRSPATGEELPLYKVPVIGRFVGETAGAASVASKFYANLEKIGEHADPVKRMGLAHESARMQEYLRDHPEARLVQAAGTMQEKIAELRREKERLVREGADKSRVRSIEERAKLAMQNFNATVARVEKQKP